MASSSPSPLPATEQAVLAAIEEVSGGRILSSGVLRDTLYELGGSAGGGVVDERIGEAL